MEELLKQAADLILKKTDPALAFGVLVLVLGGTYFLIYKPFRDRGMLTGLTLTKVVIALVLIGTAIYFLYLFRIVTVTDNPLPAFLEYSTNAYNNYFNK